MVTSFFGTHSFGGDSVYVERLSQALLRRGHEVHVVFCPGAFESVRGRTQTRKYDPPPGLVQHPLNTGRAGMMDSLWSHQTGHAGRLGQRLKSVLQRHEFDVVHLHNVSLMGACDLPELSSAGGRTTTLLTAHDYWWLCPQSLLWRPDQRVCDGAECTMCSLRRGVPPQLWRRRGWFNRVLSRVDTLLFPSQAAAEMYESRGLRHPSVHILPGLLPSGWTDKAPPVFGRSEAGERPYIAAAGRLVPEKGFQTLIPLMRQLPDLDLVIAGDGPMRGELDRLAVGSTNVRMLGLIASGEVKRMFQRARAVVVPSLFPETFGLVVAEALALGIPVIARRTGAIPELIAAAGGGETFDDEEGLLALLKNLDPVKATSTPPPVWFEDGHVGRYLEIIAEATAAR